MSRATTSRLAFESQRDQGNLKSMQSFIMEAMEKLQFATKSQIALALGLPEEKIHKRLSELRAQGRLVRTDYSLIAKSTGERQSVWALPGVTVKLSL